MQSALVQPATLSAPCRAPRAAASSRRPVASQQLRRPRSRPLTRAEGEGTGEAAAQQTATPPAAAPQQQQQQQQQQRQQQEEDPIWVRRERERAAQQGGPKDLPFGAYLLFSSLTAIAAVGSIFEYVNHNAVFGAVQPDSPLYLPLLAFFVLTGFPTAGFLFFKAVQAANAEAERMDKLDGY